MPQSICVRSMYNTHRYKFVGKFFRSSAVIWMPFWFFFLNKFVVDATASVPCLLHVWYWPLESVLKPFKNRLQNAKDFPSLPALLKFSLRQCSSESLPVSCLQNIRIQSTISTIAINKEPFMPTCYNFISHTLYRKKVFSLLSSISEALMPCEKNAPFQCRGDTTVPYVNLLYVQLRGGQGDLTDLSHF